MSPLTDIFAVIKQPTIDIVYNSDGTEDSSVCLSCRQCRAELTKQRHTNPRSPRPLTVNSTSKSSLPKDNLRTIQQQRLDYIFWHQKIPKLQLINKKILPLHLNSPRCSFSQLSDHSALLVELIVR